MTSNIITLKNLNIKINGEVLFLTAFSLYVIYAFLITTMFITMLPNNIHIIIKAIAIILIGFKACIFDKYTLKEILMCILFAITAVLIWIVTGYTLIVDIAIFIIGAKNVSFKKIVKTYLIIALPLLIVTVVSARLGIIPNLIYYRGDNIRNSFGACYPTDFAAHIFYFIMAFLYIKKPNIIYYLIFACLSVFLIKYCDARLDSVSILLAIVLSLFVSLKQNRKINIITKSFLTFSVPICSTFIIIITMAYNISNNLMVKLNKLLSSRLYLGKSGINEYGFSLFGRQIEMHGFGGITGYNKDFSTYFYIDSSFLRIALCYGSLLLLLLCIYYSVFCYKHIKANDLMLVSIVALIAINSIVAQHMVDLAYNPFLLVFLAKFNYEEKVPNSIKNNVKSLMLCAENGYK